MAPSFATMMRICISSRDPGGLEGIIADSFENSEVFDFYELGPEGKFASVAQTRLCTCMGPEQAEGVARRGISAIVVGGVSLDALPKFSEAGVKVLLANEGTAAESMKAFVSGNLREIGIEQFARLRKKKQRC